MFHSCSKSFIFSTNIGFRFGGDALIYHARGLKCFNGNHSGIKIHSYKRTIPLLNSPLFCERLNIFKHFHNQHGSKVTNKEKKVWQDKLSLKDYLNPVKLKKLLKTNTIILGIYLSLNFTFAVLIYNAYSRGINIKPYLESIGISSKLLEHNGYYKEKSDELIKTLVSYGIIKEKDRSSKKERSNVKIIVMTILTLKLLVPLKILLTAILFMTYKRFIRLGLRTGK